MTNIGELVAISVGAGIGVTITHAYQEIIKPYILARKSKVNLLKTKPTKVRTLGLAVQDWYNDNVAALPKFRNDWAYRKLPQNIKDLLHDKLNTNELNDKTQVKIEKLEQYDNEVARFGEHFIRRKFYAKPLAKAMIDIFYKQFEVATYLTTK